MNNQKMTQEEFEQGGITALVNCGMSRKEATRIMYSKGTQYTEKQIKQAQQTFRSKSFSLLK